MSEKQTKMIFTLIPQVAKAIGHVGKSRRNPQQGYAFRGIDDLLSACQGPMADAGLCIVPKVLRQTREERTTKGGAVLIYSILRVQFRVYAADGSFVEVTTCGEGMDGGDKASNKAMSSALKYCLIQLFCIPSESNDDTEAESHDVQPRTNGHARPLPTTTARATPERIGRLNLLIQQAEVGDELIAQMLVKSHAASLGEMPGRLVERCIERLERKVASRELERDDADAQVRA